MPTRDDETPLDPVEALLAECLQRPASERQAAVARACHEHPELARELQARLTLLEEFGGPLDAPDPREVPRQLGDFRLLSRLGGGGMGVVYRARQESLDREVALKLLRPDQLYFPSAHERFHREAQAVARLQHSGIVPIYTVGEHEGVPYFAMELVRGCTLAEVLAGVDGRDPARLTGRDVYAVVAGRLGLDAEAPADPPMGPPFGASWVDACLHVLRQVAVALGHAHERGVLHRDLKPSNVLLQPDGRALLCDFGLSSDASLDRMTREGSHLGTLPYMSPEQASGSSAVDATSDVYGLGVTMYELLTLELPYAGESTARTLALIERGEPAPIRARNRTVGADVETVCLAAMERDRARRYPDARAFAADLSALLERRPIRARPPGPWLRLRRAVQRRPAAST